MPIIGLLILIAVIYVVVFIIFRPRVYYINGIKFTDNLGTPLPTNKYILLIREYLGYTNVPNYRQEMSLYDMYNNTNIGSFYFNYFKGTLTMTPAAIIAGRTHPPTILYLSKDGSIANMNTALTSENMIRMSQIEKEYDDLVLIQKNKAKA